MTHQPSVRSPILTGLVAGLLALLVAESTSGLAIFCLVVGAALAVQLLAVDAVAKTLGKGDLIHSVGADSWFLPALRIRQRARRSVQTWCGTAGIVTSVAALVVCLGLWLLFMRRGAVSLSTVAAGLAVIFAVAGWGYAKALESAAQPLTWLCPNPACGARHISERHAWRCAFCKQSNTNVSMLEGCRIADCREMATGYRCPSCNHVMLFETDGNSALIANAPQWQPPVPARPGQEDRANRRLDVDRQIQDLREEQQVRVREMELRELETAVKRLGRELEAACDLDSKIREAAETIRKVMKLRNDFHALRRERTIELSEVHAEDNDEGTLLNQRLDDLDDLIHHYEKLLRADIDRGLSDL